jgi:hypothetical protein
MKTDKNNFLKNFDKVDFRRGGVIPFSFVNEELIFCISQDRKTGEFGDFGGGCKKNESIISGALREFCEETRCCFPGVNIDYLYKKSIFFSRNNMTIFFVYVEPECINLSKKTFTPNKEISNILWVKYQDFRWLVEGNSVNIKGQQYGMWNKIVKFINHVDEKYDVFNKIKLLL